MSERTHALGPTPDDHVACAGAGAVGRVVSAPRPVPASVDLSAHVVDVLDQGATSTCAAHAVAQALRTLAHSQGVASPTLPSRRYLYRDALGYAKATRGEAIRDQGVVLGDLFTAASWAGVVPEPEWPWNAARVTEEPPFAVLRVGREQRWSVDGYHRLDTEARAVQLKQALAAGHPCVFGGDVDEAFEQPDGPALVTSVGTSLGGHAMLAVGYDEDGVLICNSWGSSWRDRGYVRMAWRLFLSRAVWEVWAIDASPPLGERGFS